METVTISPKFQVVIPKSIREALGIRPGQKVQAVQYGNRIELIPFRPLAEAQGFLSGIDTTIEREQDREDIGDSSEYARQLRAVAQDQFSE